MLIILCFSKNKYLEVKDIYLNLLPNSKIIFFGMKNKILKMSVIPLFYLIIGGVFWGNHDIMMVVFSSFIAFAYHYLIDSEKSMKQNFVEISGGITAIFIIALFVKDADRILAVQYISIIVTLFLAFFFLKKWYVM